MRPILFAILALLIVTTLPVSAHHDPGHAGGPPWLVTPTATQTALPTATATVAATSTPAFRFHYLAGYLEMYVNEERAKHQLWPYTVNQALRESSYYHNLEMVRDTALCETCSGEASLHDRIVARGYAETSISAETIGGLDTSSYPSDVFRRWLRDPVAAGKVHSPDYLDFACSFVLGPGNLTYYTCDYAREISAPVPGTLTITPTRTSTNTRTPTRTMTPSATAAP